MKNLFNPYYFEDFFYNPQIEYIVKPIKITQSTIIIPGIKRNSIYDPFYKLHELEFRCKHSKNIVKIVDSIITPEMIILYVNKDARKYPYNKCILVSKLDYSDVISSMYACCKK